MTGGFIITLNRSFILMALELNRDPAMMNPDNNKSGLNPE